MGKYGLYVVLGIVLGFSFVTYKMMNYANISTIQALNIAKNSYFLGCAENLLNDKTDKQQIIVYCKEQSEEYKKNMEQFIGESN